MRTKRAELEQAVIVAARDWREADYAHDAAYNPTAEYGARDVLADCVDALEAYAAAELTGSGARWVHGSPETSRDAAALANPVQGSVRRAIVALCAHTRPPEAGFTDAQLERRLNRTHQTVSSARNWLVNAGWLQDSGRRFPTPSGRMAVVWELTSAAHRQLTEG